jgi:hypothetical protein
VGRQRARPRPGSRADASLSVVTSPDGDDLGEATYPEQIKVGEELFFGACQRFRVVDLIPFDEEDAALVGMLKVEAA